MFLAIKEMKKEKLRFIMIVSVTVLVFYLVYFLSGLAFGLAKANTTAIESWNRTGIILSKASNKNIYSSTIDESVYSNLNINAGEKINISSKAVFVGDIKDQYNMVFIGVEGYENKLIPELVDGRHIKNQEEIVLSSAFKDLAKVDIDDIIKISDTGRQFKIVGFTEDVKYNTSPVGYVDLEMASSAMMIYKTGEDSIDATSSPTPNMPLRISAILVKDKVAQKELDKYDLQYISIEDFIKQIPGYKPQVLTFSLMIGSLMLISSIIIGIFMYVLTMQKKNVFGVLKIQGLSNSYITKSVIVQTFVIEILGVIIGFILTVITFRFIPETVPIDISWSLYGVITLLSILFSFFGTVFSARSILKIDPLDAL